MVNKTKTHTRKEIKTCKVISKWLGWAKRKRVKCRPFDWAKIDKMRNQELHLITTKEAPIRNNREKLTIMRE